MEMPEIGSEYVYKASADAPIERVRVVSIEPQTTSFRAVIERIGRKTSVVTEAVPGKRLKVPWAEKSDFEAAERVWDRFRQVDLTECEEGVVHTFFDTFIPSHIAGLVVGAGHPFGSQLHPVAQVHDVNALSDVVGVPGSEFLQQADWAKVYGKLMLSPLGAMQLCKAACSHNPMPVLDYVLAKERKAQHESLHGEPEFVSGRGRGARSADEAYDLYLRYDRPRYELLRQWCGHRAASVQERLIAAEAEVRRLDLLLVEATDQLKAADPSNDRVSEIVRAHRSDVIGPDSVRPVVERPLGPMDIAQPPQRHFQRVWH